jgi:plasmid stabilization system protein ParE
VKVIWTEQAISRLEAIRDHISVDNPVAAIDLVERILDRGDELKEMGRL